MRPALARRLRAARTGGKHGHFLGAIVYIATGDSSAGFPRWLLIDGQQRLTTLTLLLAALRDHIRDSGWTGGEEDPTPKRIDAYFLKNVQEAGDREQKLVLRRHDQETLRALLDGKEWPEDASERIRENYNYFREQLLGASPAEVYRGIGCLVIVMSPLIATRTIRSLYSKVSIRRVWILASPTSFATSS